MAYSTLSGDFDYSVNKKYVDNIERYTLDDMFEYFGTEQIENHLRKKKIERIKNEHIK